MKAGSAILSPLAEPRVGPQADGVLGRTRGFALGFAARAYLLIEAPVPRTRCGGAGAGALVTADRTTW